MALNRIAPQAAQRTGIAPTYAAAGAGAGQLNTSDQYKVRNDGKVLLHFKKSGAGACTVTIVTPGTVDGLSVADVTVTVPASTGDRMCGPFPPAVFNDANGDLEFTVSEVTGLTVAVVQL